MDQDFVKLQVLETAARLKDIGERLGTTGLPLENYEIDLIRLVTYRILEDVMSETAFQFLKTGVLNMTGVELVKQKIS